MLSRRIQIPSFFCLTPSGSSLNRFWHLSIPIYDQLNYTVILAICKFQQISYTLPKAVYSKPDFIVCLHILCSLIRNWCFVDFRFVSRFIDITCKPIVFYIISIFGSDNHFIKYERIRRMPIEKTLPFCIL